MRYKIKVCPFREKFPKQSVAVFVAASLPSGISIAKINRDLQVRFDCGITAEFLSPVGRGCLERYFGENVIKFANSRVPKRLYLTPNGQKISDC